MPVFKTHNEGGGKVTSEWRNASEITLSQNGNKMCLKATGGGSHIYLLTAYTDKNSPAYRLHFGTLLEQKGDWELTWNRSTRKGKYLLIDHLGRSIRITVCESSEGGKNKLSGVYDDDDVKMHVQESYAGYSSAACWRFLKDEVMNYELGMIYSSIYKKPGGLFYENDKTNCFRFLGSQYLHLKLPYDIAKRMTTKKDHAYWGGMLRSSKELKDCWKYGISFYNDLKSISRKHPKMLKTINQLGQQCRFATGTDVAFITSLIKSFNV